MGKNRNLNTVWSLFTLWFFLTGKSALILCASRTLSVLLYSKPRSIRSSPSLIFLILTLFFTMIRSSSSTLALSERGHRGRTPKTISISSILMLRHRYLKPQGVLFLCSSDATAEFFLPQFPSVRTTLTVTF